MIRETPSRLFNNAIVLRKTLSRKNIILINYVCLVNDITGYFCRYYIRYYKQAFLQYYSEMLRQNPTGNMLISEILSELRAIRDIRLGDHGAFDS